MKFKIIVIWLLLNRSQVNLPDINKIPCRIMPKICKRYIAREKEERNDRKIVSVESNHDVYVRDRPQL